MARLVGVDLPREKRLEIALTYIFGIGRTRSKEIITATSISADVRVKDLTDDDLTKLRDYIEEHFKIEGDLRREVQADIRRTRPQPRRDLYTVAGTVIRRAAAAEVASAEANSRSK